MNQELLLFLLRETIERLEELTRKNVELIDPQYVALPEVYTSKEVLELDGLLVTELSFDSEKKSVIILTTKKKAFVIQIHDTFSSLLGKLVWNALTDAFITAMKSQDKTERNNLTNDAFEEIINNVAIENSRINRIDELYQDLQERSPQEEKSERITSIITNSRSVSEALRKLT